MRQSAFALTEAHYAAGDFKHTVLENVEQASVKVHAQQDNVAGEDMVIWSDGAAKEAAMTAAEADLPMPSAPELSHFIQNSTTSRAGVAYGKHRSVLQSHGFPNCLLV